MANDLKDLLMGRLQGVRLSVFHPLQGVTVCSRQFIVESLKSFELAIALLLEILEGLGRLVLLKLDLSQLLLERGIHHANVLVPLIDLPMEGQTCTLLAISVRCALADEGRHRILKSKFTPALLELIILLRLIIRILSTQPLVLLDHPLIEPLKGIKMLCEGPL
jgi:hypothetical protein